MNLPIFIAARYLFAKKSHNVINIISAISAIGMAIGTVALILILSIYNGFDKVIKDNLSDMDPDILLVPSEGKHFVPEGAFWDTLIKDERVESISSVLEDNVFLNYCGQQGIARAKGVDEVFESESNMEAHCIEGEFKLYHSQVPLCSVGSSLAYKMGIRAHFTSPLELFYPDRKSQLSIANPSSSLHHTQLWPKSVFSISADIDNELIIIPIKSMRELTGLDKELSAVELRLKDNSEKNIAEFIASYKDSSPVTMLDRYRQHPSLFKMMRYEKLAIFIILIFVVIIIAFNIFGSMSMLIIEKKADMQTLRALGARESSIKRIFFFEGWMISLLGLAVGLVIGVSLALIQEYTGIVKMPGNYLISSYPVNLMLGDVIWTCIGVSLTGLLISAISVRATREAA